MDATTIAAVVGFTATLLTIGGLLLQLARYRSDTRREIRSELQPNGGSSLRDSVDRIERKVDSIDKRQYDFGERLVRVETLTVARGEHG